MLNTARVTDQIVSLLYTWNAWKLMQGTVRPYKGSYKRASIKMERISYLLRRFKSIKIIRMAVTGHGGHGSGLTDMSKAV